MLEIGELSFYHHYYLVRVWLARGGVAVLDDELERGGHRPDPLRHVLRSGDHRVGGALMKYISS